MIAVGSYDSVDDAVAFRTRHGLRFPRVVYDADAKSRRAWKILSQPAGLLVGVNGKIIARYSGIIDYADVLKRI